MYKGVVIKSSLKNPNILGRFKILEESRSPNSDWELYTIEATPEQIKQLSYELDEGKWYIHFWEGRNVMVVYKDRIFEFNFDDKDNWKPAVDYGLSIGIPIEQLDFPIEQG